MRFEKNSWSVRVSHSDVSRTAFTYSFLDTLILFATRNDRKRVKSAIAFLAISFLSVAAFAQAFTLHVNITNIRNTNGKIQLQIYKDQESFSKEICWKTTLIAKATYMKGNTLVYDVAGIPAGTYGIAILDDENSDTKMNYSFLLPTEGFGFSNYYHTAWSKPKFDNFKFTVTSDLNINIKVRYV